MRFRVVLASIVDFKRQDAVTFLVAAIYFATCNLKLISHHMPQQLHAPLKLHF